MKDTKRNYYNQQVADVLKTLNSSQDGLSESQVQESLEKHGKNQLEAKKNTNLLQKFIAQFKNLMIIVLLAAALVSVFVGEGVDAIIILLVVVLNAIFGVFQEARAEQAIDALKELSAPQAHVKRNGKVETIKSEDVVPGDIVLLEAGDIIPADLRLIESAGLKMEESALTGESVPVEKTTAVLTDEKLPIGDQTNMAFMNSNVTYGRGSGVVVETGMHTQVGEIADMINNAEENTTPLQANLNQLSKVLTGLILVVAVIVFIVGMVRGEETVINMLLTAISLAVAAIPEGLPAIVTITLALGTQRMAKRHAIIRKLPAVETLGGTEIIASDKTGTLTQNKMTVEKVFVNNKLHDARDLQIKDYPYNHLFELMVLNNDTKQTEDGLIGDPTETALIQFNLDKHEDVDKLVQSEERVAEVPFDSERKLMSTYNKLADGRYLQTVKGAPDELLQRTTLFESGKEIKSMDEKERKLILDTNHELATQAIRVLGFAYQIVDEIPDTLKSEVVEQDLIFAGLIGMIDPERPEVAQAVEEAKQAGIRPLMITGDHRDTASAIAKRLGIIKEGQDDAVISGSELDTMDDKTFAKKVKQYSVYARVAPEHKVRIVNAWQKQGKVVAMTGDGVNDAPSLKQADIGIAMGITGTEVSKGASDMILADDNFSTIVVAVEEGRKVFANIQKAIQYLLSANLGEVLTLFVMTMMGWQILAPVHILWINLVTDTLPAIALGLEPSEKDVMKQKPRGRQSNFLSGGVASNVIYQGLLEGIITLGVYALAILHPVHASSALAHADALTMAFATLGLIQLFHAFNSKSIHGSIFSATTLKNKFFNWAIVLSFILLAVTIVVPGLNDIFHVTHLDLYQWAIVVGASVSIVVIVEIVKWFQRRAHR
ncbi:Calcium-transporting ATPase [Pediococcus damnosus]|uniref:P-type Ca(2+) transporter n=1 Tax=Pediococcus damnosus TaxID=51663 RepID=A0A143AEL5_9LACO|nr:cation-translocating P-type ATPase [Pediococcus damnosus]AMV62660.1 Calcium-transporting ATPase [Pediococcus damnosus]AMV67458.1 Calcium-transporting ATPase [Pediococcus damnosus]AMV69187.1 Calcium-transporting ATPase [Pediococcus damnosus]KJU73796.1 ATPase [Pediococcus damnosus LMG 28219]PIO81013.1 ATPase [Pediococcus damnosus]